MFNLLLTQPIFNLLVFLYTNITFQDLGWAIILLTLIIRLVLFPVFYKSFHNQTILQKLQPEIQKIQQQFKNNREDQAKAMMELYRQNKVNPFSSFILLFIQLPVLIALYQVFLSGLSKETIAAQLYSFMAAPTVFNNQFLGLIDVTKTSIIIVVLAALTQYISGHLTLSKTKSGDSESSAVKMAKTMVLVGPVITIVILFSLPSAVGIYWIATSVFSIGQQFYINSKVYGSNKVNNSANSSVGGV